MDTPYRFDEQWKNRVARNSEEWRQYTEALSCLKRFFREEILHGRKSAVLEWHTYLNNIAYSGAGGKKRAEQLNIDFVLIGQVEGVALRAMITEQLEHELATW